MTFLKLLFLRLHYEHLRARIEAMQQDLAGSTDVQINLQLDLAQAKGDALMVLQRMNAINQRSLRRGLA